jgi:hypothetical protein
VKRRLVLVHDSQPKRRVRGRAPLDGDIIWLRELQEVELFYDDQYESTTLTQGCEVMFSGLGISGNVQHKELDVTFRRAGEREPGTLIFTEERSWIEIYVEDYALGFVVTAYDEGERLNMPLALCFSRKHNDGYRWYVWFGWLSYELVE